MKVSRRRRCVPRCGADSALHCSHTDQAAVPENLDSTFFTNPVGTPNYKKTLQRREARIAVRLPLLRAGVQLLAEARVEVQRDLR